jgi:hypothetical protein
MIFTSPAQCGTATAHLITTLIDAGWRFEGCEFDGDLNKLMYHFETPDGVRGSLDYKQLEMEAFIYLKEERL